MGIIVQDVDNFVHLLHIICESKLFGSGSEVDRNGVIAISTVLAGADASIRRGHETDNRRGSP